MNNFTSMTGVSTTSDGHLVWVDDFTYTSWLPYKYEQYHPKWHIKQGYKNQVSHMWDKIPK